MKSRQVDNKTRKTLKIDAGLHKLLKVAASKEEEPLKDLSEGYLYDGLEKDGYSHE